MHTVTAAAAQDISCNRTRLGPTIWGTVCLRVEAYHSLPRPRQYSLSVDFAPLAGPSLDW